MARQLQSALISIDDACRYLGGISRAHFYARILPQLHTLAAAGCPATIKIGRRRMIRRSVLEAFLNQLERVWWYLVPIAVLHIHQWGTLAGRWHPSLFLHHV